MKEELSGVTIVIFIACGTMTFILLFIFAKRQIVRFALKSRRGPHMPVGHDAPKALRREIERRLDRVPQVKYEPKLLRQEDEAKYTDPNSNTALPPYYYRAKAVDDLYKFEHELSEVHQGIQRHPGENVRVYLMGLLSGPLQGVSPRQVHEICDMYEHARQDPKEFGLEQYKVYKDLLAKLHRW